MESYLKANTWRGVVYVPLLNKEEFVAAVRNLLSNQEPLSRPSDHRITFPLYVVWTGTYWKIVKSNPETLIKITINDLKLRLGMSTTTVDQIECSVQGKLYKVLDKRYMLNLTDPTLQVEDFGNSPVLTVSEPYLCYVRDEAMSIVPVRCINVVYGFSTIRVFFSSSSVVV